MTAAGQPGGPPQFGNAEANLRFLDATGALAPGLEILEIGSGSGSLLHTLQGRGCRMHGVESSAERIAESRHWFGELPIQRVSGTSLPFADDSFDLVLSFDVFEHIPDSDAHLREVRRVLRAGGRYLLQTPNKWFNVVFETIRWRSFTRFREDHCSLHTPGQLRRRLVAHGFEAQFFDVPVVNEFFKEKVRRHLGAIGLAAVALVDPDRLPLAWRTNLYVQATKKAAPSIATPRPGAPAPTHRR
jgi:SAM-dependent methyltransferase